MEMGDAEDGSSDHVIDDDEVTELSQKMRESLHGGSQPSVVGSQTRGATPEFSKSPPRQNSTAPSDAELFYGPDDDPAAGSQHSNGSHHSHNSQLMDQNSEGSGGGSQPAQMHESAGNSGARGGRSRAHSSNRTTPNSLYDSTRYPFPARRFWHEDGLLVPPVNNIEYLYSQAKSMGFDHNDEKSEAYGPTWSLVFPFDGFGLPEKMIRAIHFFTTVESLSTHNKMNGFVVQTWNLQNNLFPKFKDKDIIGVVERTCIDNVDDDIANAMGGVDLSDLLQSGENNSCGMSFKGMPLLHMNVGITGALYNSGGKEKRKLFGILYVHWLVNVDFMQLLLVSGILNTLVHCSLFAKLIVFLCCREPYWESPMPRLRISTTSTGRAILCLIRSYPFLSISHAV